MRVNLLDVNHSWRFRNSIFTIFSLGYGLNVFISIKDFSIICEEIKLKFIRALMYEETYNKKTKVQRQILVEHHNLRWLCLICAVQSGSIACDSITRRTSL